MSAYVAPISLDRFAEAVAELPVGNLHAKAAELRNSIAHLVSSNEHLRQYADDGDQDCADAIRENQEVIGRMEMRISLLKHEVESRGLLWGDREPATSNGKLEDQASRDQEHLAAGESNTLQTAASAQSTARPPGGTLGDEELARRLRAQMDENMQDEEDDGIHL